MKKVALLSLVALLAAGVSFADNGKKNKKKCAKGKTCCTKTSKTAASCHGAKAATTAKM